MLCLSRRVSDKHQRDPRSDLIFTLPDGRRITVSLSDWHSARWVGMGIEAPEDVVVNRGEVQLAVDARARAG